MGCYEKKKQVDGKEGGCLSSGIFPRGSPEEQEGSGGRAGRLDPNDMDSKEQRQQRAEAFS